MPADVDRGRWRPVDRDDVAVVAAPGLALRAEERSAAALPGLATGTRRDGVGLGGRGGDDKLRPATTAGLLIAHPPLRTARAARQRVSRVRATPPALLVGRRMTKQRNFEVMENDPRGATWTIRYGVRASKRHSTIPSDPHQTQIELAPSRWGRRPRPSDNQAFHPTPMAATEVITTQTRRASRPEKRGHLAKAAALRHSARSPRKQLLESRHQ